MNWKRIISEILSKKEWLNSTAFVFQLSILLGLITYYLFLDFFAGVFFGYVVVMLLLSVFALTLTLLALRKTLSFKGTTAPANILFFIGLFLLSAEAVFHSNGADVLQFPHNGAFFAGVLLLGISSYIIVKITDFENKHTVVLMLWITGNILLLFAVTKHWYENTAFSVRDSIVLFGSAVISLLGVFQHIVITSYGREIDTAMLLGDAKYVSSKFDEAIEHYERGLKLDPKNEYLIVRKGMTLLKMGLNENAYSLFSSASKEYPNSMEILMGAGIAATKLGRYNTALELFQRAEQIQKNAELYNNLGNVLFNMRKVDEALVAYRKAIELNKNYETAYVNAVNVLTRARRFEEAIALVRTLLELKPDSAEAHYHLSKIYLEMGDYEKSIEEVDTAIMLKPSFSDAWIWRGALLERVRQGKIEIASKPMPTATRRSTVLNILRLRIFSTLDEYQRLASTMMLPRMSDKEWVIDFSGSLEHARKAFVDKNWELAVKAGREVLEQEPENLDALLIVANSLETLGNYAEASTAYRKAAEISGMPETYLKAAITAAMAGFWLEAVESTDALLEKNRENAEAWVLKGLLLYFLDVPLSSIECFEYALAFQPENKDALYGKGLALMKLGLETEAAVCFSQANAVSIHFTEIFSKLPEKKRSLNDYLRYATELASQKKFEEAIRFLNFVLKVKWEDENVCYFAAVVYGTMKKYTKAEELLRRAIEKDPDNPNFITTLAEILRKDGRARESVKLSEDYLAGHKDAPAELIAEYALSLYEIQDYKKAKNFIEIALQKEPDNERVKRISMGLKMIQK